MQYLNKDFWRMIIGLVVVIIMALGFLYLSQFYGGQKDGKNIEPVNYMAGSKTNN